MDQPEESAPTATVFRLDKAASLPFTAVDKVQLDRLAARIPPNLRGVFGVITQETDKGLKLTGLVIQADPALEALAALYKESPVKAQKNHEMKYHRKNGRMITIEGDAFSKLLASPTEEAPGKHAAAIKIAGISRNGALSNKTSYDLDKVLTQPLTLKDRERIIKIQATIPENLRGFFICDLKPSATNLDKLEIKRLVLDPNTAMQIIGAYAHTPTGHPSSTQVIGRRALKEIAEKLPSAGQKIA